MTNLMKFAHQRIHLIPDKFKGKIYALTPVMFNGYWIAGVAIANERGYIPLPESWCNIPQVPGAYDIMADYLDEVNAHLNITQPNDIIASSMRL